MKFYIGSGILCGDINSVIVCQSTTTEPIFKFNCGNKSDVKFKYLKDNYLLMTTNGSQDG